LPAALLAHNGRVNLNAFVNRAKQSRLLRPLAAALPPAIKAWCRRLLDRVTQPSRLERLRREISVTNDLLARLIYEAARQTPRFKDPQRLLGSGFKVFSMHDEDGIIEEIFRRIGETNRWFVEFGAGDGLENCTAYLLMKGWSGAWIEGSAACYEAIGKNLSFAIREGRLKVKYSFITAENIEALLEELGVPEELDFLSIDIDRNDYWVWEAIRRYRPRAVAIEYNASWMPTVACVVPYDPYAIWDGTTYSGASLKALERLGRREGYCLVGCNFSGVTSFFVRADLAGGGRFKEPFTAENHFEPPRHIRMPSVAPRALGPLVFIEEPARAASGKSTSA
jgi:hypothetical protein